MQCSCFSLYCAPGLALVSLSLLNDKIIGYHKSATDTAPWPLCCCRSLRTHKGIRAGCLVSNRRVSSRDDSQ